MRTLILSRAEDDYFSIELLERLYTGFLDLHLAITKKVGPQDRQDFIITDIPAWSCLSRMIVARSPFKNTRGIDVTRHFRFYGKPTLDSQRMDISITMEALGLKDKKRWVTQPVKTASIGQWVDELINVDVVYLIDEAKEFVTLTSEANGWKNPRMAGVVKDDPCHIIWNKCLQAKVKVIIPSNRI